MAEVLKIIPKVHAFDLETSFRIGMLLLEKQFRDFPSLDLQFQRKKSQTPQKQVRITKSGAGFRFLDLTYFPGCRLWNLINNQYLLRNLKLHIGHHAKSRISQSKTPE